MVSEADIGSAVVAYLENQGYDTYQEVKPPKWSDRTADIVVRIPQRTTSLYWVVEIKRNLGLAVMEQARAWTRSGLCHMVSVAAIPPKKGFKPFSLEILRHFGIGLIRVQTLRRGGCEVSGISTGMPSPRLHRLDRKDLAKVWSLSEQHKTFARAGTNAGYRWTPFTATCAALYRFVSNNNPCTFSSAMKAIRGHHHYSSDASCRSSMLTWLREGRVAGLTLREEGKSKILVAESCDRWKYC